MTISVEKAQHFIYANGILWERMLFAYLFQDGEIDRVQECVACYRNPNGGFGHALEHDIRTPDSHPLALEYILGMFVKYDLSPGTLFDEAAAWCEANRAEDGSLKNPASVLAYPHAPWWNEGGQTAPDSITGNLHKLGKASPRLLASTTAWARANLTLEKIKANEWLFMAYHAYDYFFNITDYPDLEAHQQATVDNIVACATKIPPEQYYSLFSFAPRPDAPVAQAIPDVITAALDHLEKSQQDDGSWHDQHGLAQWFPMTTIGNLITLRRYGRL